MAKQGVAYLVNTESFPCVGTLLFHATKLLGSFVHHGYQFKIIESDQKMSNTAFAPADLIYFSNHGVSAGAITIHQLKVLDAVRKSGATPIFWFWYQHADLLDRIFGSRWILTGEHYRAEVVIDSHLDAASCFGSRTNFVPSIFASSLTPSQVGTLERTRSYRASFVGARYQRSLNLALRILRPKVLVRYTPPFISEAHRESVFLGSQVVLGWHSMENSSNGVVGERVYEGIAMGSIVVTDNPYAQDATDGIAIFTPGLEDVLEVVDRAWNDSEFFLRKQAAGYSWARSFGTYSRVAASFISRLG